MAGNCVGSRARAVLEQEGIDLAAPDAEYEHFGDITGVLRVQDLAEPEIARCPVVHAGSTAVLHEPVLGGARRAFSVPARSRQP